MTNPDEVKDKFYNDLDDVTSATPRTDKLILLGDFLINMTTALKGSVYFYLMPEAVQTTRPWKEL